MYSGYIGHDQFFSIILVVRVSTATRGFDNFFAAGTKFRVMYQSDLEAHMKTYNLSCCRASRHE